MKLVEVTIDHFRNYLSSPPVQIEPDVTCLVGKNESGKSAFLTALYRLNPENPDKEFDVASDYPAWLEKQHRLDGIDLNERTPIAATFAIDDEDAQAVEEVFGAQLLSNRELKLWRTYGNALKFALSVDEKAAVKLCCDKVGFKAGKNCKTVSDLAHQAKEVANSADDAAKEAAAKTVTLIGELFPESDVKQSVWKVLKPRVPQFFLFSQYSTLPYSAEISVILQKGAKLNESQRTLRSLLLLAAASDEYLKNAEYERRKRELENVANAITRIVKRYWSQNAGLRVTPDITTKTVNTGNGQQSVLDQIMIRIWDDRHELSLPFTEHSAGFQWFFSFVAAFSEYERQKIPVVILLDEPAVGLHAKAQADFLRFIDDRLATKHQVVYTTHSPFMVEPGRLHRVRMVEDKGPDVGTRINKDVLSTDRDTLFPLQGALGYDLVQHLFIAPHNLVVEGTSDFTYMTAISDFVRQQAGLVALDERWSIVPVGGADLIPSFVALLGNKLDVTVVVDSRKGGNQRLQRIASEGILKNSRIIGIGTVTGAAAADIEDLFEPQEYVDLYNAAFAASLTLGQLSGLDPMVSRIARHLGVDRFDHGVPADYFLRNRDRILPTLSPATLQRFSKLFKAVNATLPA